MLLNLGTTWSQLLDKMQGWLDSFILSMPNILVAIIVFIICYLVSRYLQKLADRLLSRVIVQEAIRSLLSNLVAVFVIIFGIVLALSILNLDGALKSILAGAGVAGLAISLALQGTLANTFSGIFIAIKDELNIGDWIETNGYAGTILEIDLRNTKIIESDNNIVVIPNKLILDNPFKNFGLTKRIRSTITCGIGYNSDLEFAKKVAIESIEAIFPPDSNERIEFYYTNFGESSIDFMLRFWVDARENLTALEVKSRAIMQIKKTFENNHITIPYPMRTLISEMKASIE